MDTPEPIILDARINDRGTMEVFDTVSGRVVWGVSEVHQGQTDWLGMASLTVEVLPAVVGLRSKQKREERPSQD